MLSTWRKLHTINWIPSSVIDAGPKKPSIRDNSPHSKIKKSMKRYKTLSHTVNKTSLSCIPFSKNHKLR